MRVDKFDFKLPPELVALRPAVPRHSARLLVVRPDGALEHMQIANLPDLLQSGDLIAVNDTRVFAARLHGVRLPRAHGGGSGARIEVTLHKRTAPDRFLAFVRPAKRLACGDIVRFSEDLHAEVLTRAGGEAELVFPLGGEILDAALERTGEPPLPPYIATRRTPDEQDRRDYQTVFAAARGSVAAPTAGLHFTPELLAGLTARGIGRTSITLHVGAGTFLPVSVQDTVDHRMHAEWLELTPAAAGAMNAARGAGGRIAAVGTTTLRTLETAADDEGRIHPFRGETEIFITPGYRFKTAQILLTNFHLPRSTLFMLTCAFSGTEIMRAAYAEAIRQRYRFYSYGDACLLFRPSP